LSLLAGRSNGAVEFLCLSLLALLLFGGLSWRARWRNSLAEGEWCSVRSCGVGQSSGVAAVVFECMLTASTNAGRDPRGLHRPRFDRFTALALRRVALCGVGGLVWGVVSVRAPSLNGLAAGVGVVRGAAARAAAAHFGILRNGLWIWPSTHSAQHTASTAATPHYPQGRRQTPANAPTPLKLRHPLTQMVYKTLSEGPVRRKGT